MAKYSLKLHRNNLRRRDVGLYMEKPETSYKAEAMVEGLRSAQSGSPDMLELTARIVAAHVGNNSLDTVALPGLIQDVYRALTGLGRLPSAPAEKRASAPAVPWKKSVFPDYIICLEDGKKLKMLKRHLKTSYNLSPEEYRERWGLPADYPMVAPNYAHHRSSLAKKSGLGKIKGAR